MDVVELQRETRSSIELQRSAKGDYYWTIKVYFDSEQTDQSIHALERIKLIDTVLRDTFMPTFPDVGI